MSEMSDGARQPQAYYRIPNYFQYLGSDALNKIQVFYKELMRINPKLNLIARRSELEADMVHFADSIQGSEIVLKHAKSDKIFDIGSGNGLPAIVLALLSPAIQVVSLELDERKAEFLKIMASRLELSNFVVEKRRFEDIDPGSVKVAVTRGSMNISRTLLLARRAVAIGGSVYHFKGRNWVREVADIPSQLCTFWTPQLVDEYELPVLAVRMAVVSTRRLE